MEDVVVKGELLEEYATDRPFPSGLFFRMIRGRPIHVVAGIDNTECTAYIVTAYVPTREKFGDDYRSRRR